MKRRIAIAAALAATLIGAAACGSGSEEHDGIDNPLDGKGKTIKVWLMVDAQSGWPQVVDDANARFTAATGAKVDVEYQQWTNHLTKVDTTLAGTDVPDVVELGNTDSRSTSSAARSPTSRRRSHVRELAAPGSPASPARARRNGKTYCVPYYAGARVLIYRTDLFTAAGLTPPTTYDELTADADKLQAAHDTSDPNFAAFYMPGALLVRRHVVRLRRGRRDRDQGLGRQVDRHARVRRRPRPV